MSNRFGIENALSLSADDIRSERDFELWLQAAVDAMRRGIDVPDRNVLANSPRLLDRRVREASCTR